MKNWSDVKLLLHLESTSLIRGLFENIIFLLFSWIPGILGLFLRSFMYKLVIKGKGLLNIEENTVIKRPKDIELGKNVFIDHNVYLQGMPCRVKIGDNSALMHNCEIHPYQTYVPLGDNESKRRLLLKNSGIEIGKNTMVGSFSIITGQGKTKIGNDVLIGPHCTISPINHSFKKGELIKNQKPSCKGIIIEDDVWLGSGAIILDGVKIGKGSVIGAGSVVTKSIPSYSVAVGVPAKVIRKRT